MRRPWRSKTCQRIWDERRPNLGRETNESGTRDERIWDEKRMCNVPRSTKSIAFVCLHSYEQPKGSPFCHHLTLNTPAFLTSFLNSVIYSSLKFNTKNLSETNISFIYFASLFSSAVNEPKKQLPLKGRVFKIQKKSACF